MRVLKLSILTIIILSANIESAKILCLYLMPIKSHNLAYIPLTQKLLKRGHEIVSITVDPIFTEGRTPENMTEIDVHDISYKIWTDGFRKDKKNSKDTNMYSKFIQAFNLLEKVFLHQCKSDQIKKFVNDISNKFDLIMFNGAGYPSIVFSCIHEVPAISMSSAIIPPIYINILGITGYIKYYVHFYRQTHKKDISLWETYVGLYEHFSALLFFDHNRKNFEDMFRQTLAPSSPPMTEMFNNIHMHLMNVHIIWDSIRPTSSNIITLGYIQKKAHEELPTDLQMYLDSSKHGVIYISFGTNVLSSALPAKVISDFKDVISQLPYDVLWKWDKDEMPDKPENIRIFKWLPQADLLKHPNIKLFITQAGQHSTDEAIHAGVPLIGIPLIFDQFNNAEKYVYHGIGKKLELNFITPEKLKDAIDSVIGNESYRRNIAHLRNLLEDKPLSSMDKAIWTIEYVLRHGGAQHMRSPAFNMSSAEYFEFELVSIFIGFCVTLLYIIVNLLLILKRFVTYLLNYINNKQ